MPKTAQSEMDNKKIARDLLVEVFNKRALHRIPEFIAPDYRAHHAPIKGVAGVEEHARTFLQAYPDLQITVEGQIAEGDVVVTWFSAVGTHAGEWQGIKPTHRQLHLTGVNIQRIRNGLIVEQIIDASNSLEALLELGVIQWVRG